MNGNILRRTYPNGVVEQRTFDALNRFPGIDDPGISDPGAMGTLNNSIYWNNSPSQTITWNGTGNQSVDPATIPSASGADIPVCPYSQAGIRRTEYFYDLNGNILRRTYPNGVAELRSFDSLNRLNSSEVQSSAFKIQENINAYDKVGSLMEQTNVVVGLADIPQTAVYTWGYDKAYRLTNEVVNGGSSSTSTAYDWDAAGNRQSKTVTVGGSPDRTITYSTPSSLNQMTGWSDGTTNAVYAYDDNGSRTNATLATATSTKSTIYTYDEDQRLIGAVAGIDDPGASTNIFAYDYRSRRYYRATPTETNLCVFDGGLSIQEYNVSQASSLPSVDKLSVEYLRGPNLGGGVGGMVYSIRSDGIRCSHANHRGDVIARTSNAGILSWFARYEAYGTRFDEWGSNPDRQMANTKEEEKGLGILNEGMRPRDLYHGVMLTRDPAGFIDGPNLYCYVRNNPIIKFDPLGLSPWDVGKYAAAQRAGRQYNPTQFMEAFLDQASNDPVLKEIGQNACKIVLTAYLIYDFIWLDKFISPPVPGQKPDTKPDTPKTSETQQKQQQPSLEQSGSEKPKPKKQPGSYTNEHESGKKYHGKGSESRARQSGREKAKEYNDTLKETDWKPAETERDAFKDEAQRIEQDGGVQNPDNYNKINSPGKKYREQDGDS